MKVSDVLLVILRLMLLLPLAGATCLPNGLLQRLLGLLSLTSDGGVATVPLVTLQRIRNQDEP